MSSNSDNSSSTIHIPTSSPIEEYIDPQEDQDLDKLLENIKPKSPYSAVTIAQYFHPHVEKLQKDLSMASFNKQKVQLQINKLKDNFDNNILPKSFNNCFRTPESGVSSLTAAWKQIQETAKTQCFQTLITHKEEELATYDKLLLIPSVIYNDFCSALRYTCDELSAKSMEAE